MADLTRTVTSLDRPVGENGDTALGDLLGDERAGPAEEVEVALRDDALCRALDGLPEEERTVVSLRYGINVAGGPGRDPRGQQAPRASPSPRRASSRSVRSSGSPGCASSRRCATRRSRPPASGDGDLALHEGVKLADVAVRAGLGERDRAGRLALDRPRVEGLGRPIVGDRVRRLVLVGDRDLLADLDRGGGGVILEVDDADRVGRLGGRRCRFVVVPAAARVSSPQPASSAVPSSAAIIAFLIPA